MVGLLMNGSLAIYTVWLMSIWMFVAVKTKLWHGSLVTESSERADFANSRPDVRRQAGFGEINQDS
jgi:hypothetical protein